MQNFQQKYKVNKDLQLKVSVKMRARKRLMLDAHSSQVQRNVTCNFTSTIISTIPLRKTGCFCSDYLNRAVQRAFS